eukprot:110393-Chlamydomonas_euryale.AAC.1
MLCSAKTAVLVWPPDADAHAIGRHSAASADGNGGDQAASLARDLQTRHGESVGKREGYMWWAEGEEQAVSYALDWQSGCAGRRRRISCQALASRFHIAEGYHASVMLGGEGADEHVIACAMCDRLCAMCGEP